MSFLAELLGQVSREDQSTWPVELRPGFCHITPARDAQHSASLRFSAAANMLLSELMLLDKHDDSRWKAGWHFLRKLGRAGFTKARADLASFGVDIESITILAGSQSQIESQQPASKRIAAYSYVTSEITARIFEAGFRYVKAQQHAENARRLGKAYGAMIYLLDAFEDFEVDQKRNHFNAFGTYFGTSSNSLGTIQRAEAIGLIEQYSTEATHAIRSMLPPEQSEALTSKLTRQLKLRLLGAEVEPLIPTRKRVGFRMALEWARKLLEAEREAKGVSRLLYPLKLSGITLAVAALSPRSIIALEIERHSNASPMLAANGNNDGGAVCGLICLCLCLGACHKACCEKERVGEYTEKDGCGRTTRRTTKRKVGPCE